MKNNPKSIGIIALVAVIIFSMAGCSDEPDNGGIAPTITTTTLAGGTVGTQYSATLAASGDTPITWSIESGALPTGLSLSGNAISGTPITANTFNFTVKATNATGSDTKALSIVITTITPSGGEECDCNGAAEDCDCDDCDCDPCDPVTLAGYFRFEVTTTTAGETFALPANSRLGDNYTKPYDWVISWGDGATEAAEGVQDGTNAGAGIPHTYAATGVYTVTISPAADDAEAWLGAFGFYGNTNGAANAQTNKNMVTKLISPITPLMTRTQAQLDDGTAPDYEWAFTFYGCTNLTMGDAFTFSPEWNSITTVGNFFAYSMFRGCTGAAFTMNSVFNFPQGITTVGDSFAASMFYGCSGVAFTMNSVFNLPDGITTVGNFFAYAMFYGCTGAAFTMNSVFNLPQSITTVGTSFANAMFYGSTGAAFTMNSVFNLPQSITTVGTSFAYTMFYGCTGAAFKVNDVFKFPVLAQAEVDKSNVFYRTFYNMGNNSGTQVRTAASIINGNPTPSSNRETFTNATGFSDLAAIPVNWGGGGDSLSGTWVSPEDKMVLNNGEIIISMDNVELLKGTYSTAGNTITVTFTQFHGSMFTELGLSSQWYTAQQFEAAIIQGLVAQGMSQAAAQQEYEDSFGSMVDPTTASYTLSGNTLTLTYGSDAVAYTKQ